MTKIAINCCYGGFSLSSRAVRLLAERNPKVYGDLNPEYGYLDYDDDRSESTLVSLIEELGSMASGPHANLRVVEIPDGVPWFISEYDGSESVKINWRALCAEYVSASELDEGIARDRMEKALKWGER